MRKPRSRRIEEQRARKRIVATFIASVAIVLILVIVGPRVLVKVSLFLGNTRIDTPSESNDTTIPFPPVIESLPTATSSARIVIKGYAEPNTTLQLFVNNREVKKILLDDEGDFRITNIALSPGNNTIIATVTDMAKNTSKESITQTVVYLNAPPKLEIAEPKNGLTTHDEKITVSGITDSNNQVTINSRFVTVRDDGSFEHTMKLSDGENKITVIATNQAGIQTTIEQTVTRS